MQALAAWSVFEAVTVYAPGDLTLQLTAALTYAALSLVFLVAFFVPLYDPANESFWLQRACRSLLGFDGEYASLGFRGPIGLEAIAEKRLAAADALRDAISGGVQRAHETVQHELAHSREVVPMGTAGTLRRASDQAKQVDQAMRQAGEVHAALKDALTEAAKTGQMVHILRGRWNAAIEPLQLEPKHMAVLYDNLTHRELQSVLRDPIQNARDADTALHAASQRVCKLIDSTQLPPFDLPDIRSAILALEARERVDALMAQQSQDRRELADAHKAMLDALAPLRRRQQLRTTLYLICLAIVCAGAWLLTLWSATHELGRFDSTSGFLRVLALTGVVLATVVLPAIQCVWSLPLTLMLFNGMVSLFLAALTQSTAEARALSTKDPVAAVCLCVVYIFALGVLLPLVSVFAVNVALEIKDASASNATTLRSVMKATLCCCVKTGACVRAEIGPVKPTPTPTAGAPAAGTAESTAAQAQLIPDEADKAATSLLAAVQFVGLKAKADERKFVEGLEADVDRLGYKAMLSELEAYAVDSYYDGGRKRLLLETLDFCTAIDEDGTFMRSEDGTVPLEGLTPKQLVEANMEDEFVNRFALNQADESKLRAALLVLFNQLQRERGLPTLSMAATSTLTHAVERSVMHSLEAAPYRKMMAETYSPASLHQQVYKRRYAYDGPRCDPWSVPRSDEEENEADGVTQLHTSRCRWALLALLAYAVGVYLILELLTLRHLAWIGCVSYVGALIALYAVEVVSGHLYCGAGLCARRKENTTEEADGAVEELEDVVVQITRTNEQGTGKSIVSLFAVDDQRVGGADGKPRYKKGRRLRSCTEQLNEFSTRSDGAEEAIAEVHVKPGTKVVARSAQEDSLLIDEPNAGMSAMCSVTAGTIVAQAGPRVQRHTIHNRGPVLRNEL